MQSEKKTQSTPEESLYDAQIILLLKNLFSPQRNRQATVKSYLFFIIKAKTINSTLQKFTKTDI